MSADLAQSITRAASQQTYYTIRFLVDRARVADAFRAYGYFRWLDDLLDADAAPALSEREGEARRAFVARQQRLLDSAYRGEAPRAVTREEHMLIELIQHDDEQDSGLQAYLRHMLRLMDFDSRRRGRLISQAELDQYTRWLATAVTEALLHFIGHAGGAPRAAARYRAVTGAHITHMLRDTFDDLPRGYYNIPREVLAAAGLGPQAVHSPAYRAWVQSRVRLAREHFQAGRAYFAQVPSARCRLAAMAYTARFSWLLDTLEREDYVLRASYPERKSVGTGLRMGWLTLAALAHRPAAGRRAPAVSGGLPKR
jgi:hypothetical protein